MITDNDIALIGKVNKTHGVKGELSVSFELPEVADSLAPGSCLVMEVEGILTPFFVRTVRPRSSEALLITLDGIDTQDEAQPYAGRAVYMPKADMPEIEEEELSQEGMYASDLVGYQAIDSQAGEIGKIIDIDDSTENELFVIERSGEQIIYVPIADEFIADIDQINKIITFDLPIGLLSL